MPFAAAVAAWAASLHPVRAPMFVGGLALGLLFVARRAAHVVILLSVAVAVLAGHALAGLTPAPEGRWTGAATLLTDPVERGGGTTAIVHTGIGRLEVSAWGPAGRILADRVAGEAVKVEGELGPPRSRQQWRHVRGRLQAERVVRTDRTSPTMRLPNAIRSLVIEGANGLPEAQRPVYTGFVLGDDRGRPEEMTEWFEAAGLSHLLVVSGQNLVFIMMLTDPVLSRLGRRPRIALTFAVLLGFMAVTRFEPSVIRASAMAGVSTLAVLSGRPADGRRVLAIAVVALIVIDPLLTRSIGFQLSVAASAGIVLMAAAIERRLPGPRRLRAVLAVTIAAQSGVAPVLVPLFGPMPLVAVPANVLVEPVAGLVMMWGSSVGLLAGALGAPWSSVLLLPARAGLWWIIFVARLASVVPSIGVGVPVLLGLAAFAGVRLVLRRRHRLDHPIR
ncbi:MAG: ComEC/Rec2 family competence protein [Acidimicrobiia bacterium]|nr:ComEC/Rec2 family competence protein [Acidimicrobiia bacterium]